MISKHRYPLHEVRNVPRPFAEVAQYLTDFSTIEQWDPGVFSAEKKTPGEPDDGTIYDLVLNVAGRKVPMQYQVTGIERTEGLLELTLSGRADTFSADDVIRVTANADNTATVDYHAVITLNNAPRWLGPIIKSRMNKLGKAAVDGLVTALTDSPVEILSAAQKMGNALVLPAARNFTQRGYLNMPNKGLSQRLDGQCWVITGPTGGIGLAAAKEMARLGAELILLGRGEQRLAQARQDIADFTGRAENDFKIIDSDLATLAGCDNACAALLALRRPVHGLINNAGALFAERKETSDGFERALAINLIAPYRLTQSLLPELQSTQGRVINVASGGQYLQRLAVDDMNYNSGDYDGSKAYARAKRALVWLTAQWAQQYPSVTFAAMHPGWVATPGLSKSLPAFEQKMQRRLRTPRMGADTIVWLASTQQNSKNGAFWFDRQVHPTDVLPKTAVTAEQGKALKQWLAKHVAQNPA